MWPVMPTRIPVTTFESMAAIRSIGGTSAVAPLWAGLIARINSNKGGHSVGYVNPILYQNQAAFSDITQGNNGDFAAAPNWDACTGMGSPNGTKVAAAL